MDSVGHKLSYEGIEVLRQVQKKHMPFVSKTILPSKSSISRTSKTVEQHGKGHAPCSLTNLPKELGGGETISFNEQDVLPIILKASKMDNPNPNGSNESKSRAHPTPPAFPKMSISCFLV